MVPLLSLSTLSLHYRMTCLHWLRTIPNRPMWRSDLWVYPSCSVSAYLLSSNKDTVLPITILDGSACVFGVLGHNRQATEIHCTGANILSVLCVFQDHICQWERAPGRIASDQ